MTEHVRVTQLPVQIVEGEETATHRITQIVVQRVAEFEVPRILITQVPVQYVTEFEEAPTAPGTPTLTAEAQSPAVARLTPTLGADTDSWELYQDEVLIESGDEGEEPPFWDIGDLTPGQSYSWVLRAINEGGFTNSAPANLTMPVNVLPRPFVEIVEVAQTWATWRANRATEWRLYHALQDIWDPDPAFLAGTFPPGTEWIMAEAAAGEVNYFTLTRIVPDGRELVFLRRVVDLTAALDPEVGALWTTTDPGTPPQHARLDIGQASGDVFLRELHRGDDSEFEPGPENLIASYPVQVERMFVPTPPGGWFVVVDTNAGGSTASDAVQVA
jgi:hypothetical protein